MKLLRTLSLIALCLMSARSYASVINEVESNNSIAQAQNLDAFFTLDNDAFVTQATTFRHASVLGHGDFNGDLDFYRFTVTAGSLGIFDIDQGMPDLDAWLNLYGPNGNLLVSQDDGIVDPGSVSDYDSYFTYTFGQSGVYTVSVGRWPNVGLNRNQDYRLNVSVQAPAPQAVPEPGSLALLGTGLLGIGALMRRRRLQK